MGQELRVSVNTGDANKKLDDLSQAADDATQALDKISAKPVKIDTTGAVDQLDAVTDAADQAAKKVDEMSKKPIKLDTSYSVGQLQDMADSVNAFTQEIGKAIGKPVKLLNVTDNAEEIKKLIGDFQEVIRLSTTVRGPLNQVGQGPGNRPVTPMQLDQTLRQDRNYMQATMSRLMLHNANTSAKPADVGLSYQELTGRIRPAPIPGENVHPKQRPAQNDSRFSKVASSAVQGLGAGGVAGGAVASFARGAEQANDAGMGVMGILKGGGVAALAYGAYKAVSAGVGAVSDKMDAGKQENIEVDKFRRALGATNESFEQLRNQSRAVGEQFNLTYEQSRKLTVEFANIAKVNSPGLVGMGIGLAQATGADESQGIGFMATMRRSGSLGEKTADARLLSIQFAEALKRTGSVLNSGELMGAMGNFATTTAQRSLGAANVEGFTALLSSMVGSGTPGLHGNVGNAASILNRADASFQRGGNMGEASNTLQFIAMGGDKVGLLGIKMRQDAGMFATADSVFGNKDSQVNQLLRSGGGQDMTRFSGKESGISQVLKTFAASNVSLDSQLLSLSNMFDLRREEGATLMNLHSQKNLDGSTRLDGLNAMLEQYKGSVDPTKLSSHGLMAMADVHKAGLDTDQLMQVRDKMAAREGLTKEQKDGLDKAKNLTVPKELQDALVKVANTFEREKNLGEQAQVTAAKIEHSTARMADLLIPAAQGSKDLLSNLLSWMAPDSAEGKARKNAQRWDAYGADPGAMADRNAHYDRKRKLGGHSPHERARIDAEQREDMGSYAGQSIRRGMSNDPRRLDGAIPQELYPRMKEIDAELRKINPNWIPGMTQATFMAESNMNPFAISPAKARGLAQFMPDAQADAEKMAGRKFNAFDPMDSAEMFRIRMAQELKRNPTVAMAQKSYNAGNGNRDKGFRETEAYPGRINSHLLRLPAQLPAGHAGDRPGQAQASQTGGVATANIVVKVESADGLKASAPQYPTSMVFKPKATGAWQSLVQ